MRSWFHDVRYGLRTLLRVPAFTVLAVLTLALGIGANTTIFSWINSTLLNPIPGATRAEELLSLTRGGDAETPYPFSYPDYADLRDQNHSFSGVTAFSIESMTLTGTGHAERVWGSLVSANYFDVLGVKAVLGRVFLPDEEQKAGGAPFVVISYSFWQTRYGAAPSIIGTSININQHPYTIVGVAPPRFQGSQTGLRSDMWIPVVMQQQILSAEDILHRRDESWLLVMGRLKPGVTQQQTHEDVNILMQRIAAQYPDTHKGHDTVTVHPLWRAPFGANGYLYVLLPMLLAIAGVVLLLACTNVANLLLVRSVARRREIAIRLSLGASRWRLVRQLLLESMLLALLGGLVALLITVWTAGTFLKFIPRSELPIVMDIHIDRAVLLATLVISIFTGLIFGILPALRSSRLAPLAVLKEESSGASSALHKARLSSGLAVVQISLSLVLLICSGLFIRSFQAAQGFDPGFNSEHVLLGSYDLLPSAYTQEQGLEFDRQLLAKLQAQPGVQSVTLANRVPLGYTFSSTTVKIQGYTPKPDESMDIEDNFVGPGYLRTMQIPLVAGREFTFNDTPKSQLVLVVNQALVDRYWPHQEAIGKHISIQDKTFSVIGVARNSSYTELHEDPKPFLYMPFLQEYSRSTVVHVRVAGDPEAFAPVMEKTIHELNADLAVFDVNTLSSWTQNATTGERIAGTFVGAFGLLALALAAVGIYGVVAYTTRQRTREIGIRMALGAGRFNILRLVLNHGLTLTALGMLIGLAAAWALTRFLKSLLFGISSTDALTFVCVTLLLCTVALLACYLPARRATRVDPIIALRYE
ncbi:MAG TPA: ABC transporter permease [Candidatus Angelobacter sp.]